MTTRKATPTCEELGLDSSAATEDGQTVCNWTAPTVRECPVHRGEYTEPDDAELVERAREKYTMQSSNDIEIDEDASVSRGDGGAWVRAWVWVEYDDHTDQSTVVRI